MNWITENVAEFFRDWIGATISAYGDLLNNIFYSVVDLANENAYVIGAKKMLILVSLSLISLIVIKIVTSGYLLETDYDSEADPFNLIVKISEVTAIICNSGWIFNYALQLSKDFVNDIIGSTDLGGYKHQTQALLDIDPSTVNASIITYIGMLFVIQISFIVFTVISGLRGGELIVMNIFFPVFALDLLTNNHERWDNFVMGYFLAFFTYGIQILFFIIALKSYSSTSFDKPEYFLNTLIWMIVAIRAPKFLEKYMYKSGIGNAASSGIRMVVQTAAIKAV